MGGSRLTLPPKCQEEFGCALPLSAEVVERLSIAPWPGNVRQLRNIMRTLALDGLDTESFHSTSVVIERKRLSQTLDRLLTPGPEMRRAETESEAAVISGSPAASRPVSTIDARGNQRGTRSRTRPQQLHGPSNGQGTASTAKLSLLEGPTRRNPPPRSRHSPAGTERWRHERLMATSKRWLES